MYFYSILSSIFFLPPSSFSRDKRPGRSQIPLILPFTFGERGCIIEFHFPRLQKIPVRTKSRIFSVTQNRKAGDFCEAVYRRRFFGQGIPRESGCHLHFGPMAPTRADDGYHKGEQSFRNRLCRKKARPVPSSLVHPCRGDRPVRPRHAGGGFCCADQDRTSEKYGNF